MDKTKFKLVSQKQFRTEIIVDDPDRLWDKEYFYRFYINFYAECLVCGEAHYLNIDNKMQVNGRIVKSCIVCNVKKY